MTGDLLDVAVRDQAGVTVLAVAGELDVSNVEAMRSSITRVRDGSPGLVVDLSALRYIDSTGIAVLYELVGHVREHERRLVLVCCADAQPRRVLDLTGLTGEADVHEDLAGALRALDPAP